MLLPVVLSLIPWLLSRSSWRDFGLGVVVVVVVVVFSVLNVNKLSLAAVVVGGFGDDVVDVVLDASS